MDRWSGGLAEPGGRERSNASRGFPIPFIAGTEGKKVLRRSLMISSSMKRRIERQGQEWPCLFCNPTYRGLGILAKSCVSGYPCSNFGNPKTCDMWNIYAILEEFFEVKTLARNRNLQKAEATPSILWFPYPLELGKPACQCLPELIDFWLWGMVKNDVI